MRIKVYKSKKMLEVWDDYGQLSTYPIGIGKTGVGHKKIRDDMKTPEGEYEICFKNPKSKFHLSLALNYPNLQDAESALAEKRISQQEYDAIVTRFKSGDGSDWSTPLGGEIYIHGGLEDKDWSEGCVRMYNRDIEALYQQLGVGTKVSIYP